MSEVKASDIFYGMCYNEFIKMKILRRYGYEIKDDTYVFCFHGAKEGRKLELIKKSPNVVFEMDTDCLLHIADTACKYSTHYQSIIVNGILSIVSEPEEKKMGLSLIMEHNTGKLEWDFDEKMLNMVIVFKLEVYKMSCKEH